MSLVHRCLVPLLLVTLPAAAGVPWDKVHPRVVQDAAGAGQVEFIVVLDEQADLSHAAAVPTRLERGQRVFDALTEVASRTQAPLVTWLAQHEIEHRSFWIANMIWARAELDVVAALASRADVRRIDANPTVRFTPSPRDPAAAPADFLAVEWNIAKVNADEVWALGHDGDGVVVGGHDTGYEWDHPALMGQYRGWNGASANHDHNWHDAIHSGNGPCGHDSPEPCDDIDHGTHTMGIMVGDDGGANRIGMAPGARWIGCRNMDEGEGTPATYSECFQFFLAPTDASGANPDPALAPHVINSSWTCPPSEGCSHATLQAVVNNTRAAGIVIVGVATNVGSSCSTIDEPPAIYEGVITTGATNPTDNIWVSSARGPVTVDGSGRLKPDVSAPGVNIRSSVRGGNYAVLSGTSMAAPHVAGLVALLLDARPDLTGHVDEIGTLVTQSALPRTTAQNCGGFPGSQVPNPVYGWGRIDALETLFGDQDGDGVNNLTDCKPTDGTVWATPGPAVGLTLDGEANTQLAWTAPGSPGAGALVYDLLRGGAADDFTSTTCVASDISATTAVDSDPPGAIAFYLVRAENACGGHLGANSSGIPRTGGSCPAAGR